MRPPKAPNFPESIERAYQLWLWIDERVTNFPASVRPALGARIQATAFDLLDTVGRQVGAWMRAGSSGART